MKNRGAWLLQFMGSQRVRHDLVTHQSNFKSPHTTVLERVSGMPPENSDITESMPFRSITF